MQFYSVCRSLGAIVFETDVHPAKLFCLAGGRLWILAHCHFDAERTGERKGLQDVAGRSKGSLLCDLPDSTRFYDVSQPVIHQPST